MAYKKKLQHYGQDPPEPALRNGPVSTMKVTPGVKNLDLSMLDYR